MTALGVLQVALEVFYLLEVVYCNKYIIFHLCSGNQLAVLFAWSELLPSHRIYIRTTIKDRFKQHTVIMKHRQQNHNNNITIPNAPK